MGHGIDYNQLPRAGRDAIAVVAARWNGFVVEPMLDACVAALREAGVEVVEVVRVPGAFELPVAAARLAPYHSAVVCLGAVIRGDTPHFDYVAGEAARGLQQVAVSSKVPVIFGVLTTNTAEQAQQRADPARDNKGREFALAALETLRAIEHWPIARGDLIDDRTHLAYGAPDLDGGE